MRRCLPAIIACVLLCSRPLDAQRPAGEIQLHVQDPSGAPVPASGALRSLDSGVEQTFDTGPQGAHTFPHVAYGRYRLTASAPGFAAQSVILEVSSSAAVQQTLTLALKPQTASVEVVATTPLAGVGVTPDQIPAPVQVATHRELEESGAVNLADFMNKRLNGVHLNEIQGNPYQPDLNYRGYTASPLLGTPQGVSIYMDGVRLNQPFADVVSWDLIPQIAIHEAALMPGSNPLFGLNTLGGSVSLESNSGHTRPGAAITVSGGSFGRKAAELEYGGSTARGWNWYGAANLFFEDGWRQYSPSNVRQFFGRGGWQRAYTSISLSASYANNALTGNGLGEQRFLAQDYTSFYTKPDITANRSPLVNLSVRHSFGGRLTLSANTYYRYIRSTTMNGDVNEPSLDQSLYQLSAADIRALTAAGYTGFPTTGSNASNTPFPYWRCIAQALQGDEPAEKCNGIINRTRTGQHSVGANGQATWFTATSGLHNQFTAGMSYDRSSAGFEQFSQLGYIAPDRSIVGVNAFADGVTGGTIDGEPFDTRVDLGGLVHTGSAYVADTLSVGRAWNFTASARYNRIDLENRDRIRPEGGPASLNGHHVFDRLNPAAGLTYSPIPVLNLYASYSEGSRAPTSVELGCANPEQPCRLPNALTGDPPLEQVVAKTWEAGIRSSSERTLQWSAGWYRARNSNDLLFVSSTQTGLGYFRNFGATLRQGAELSARTRFRTLTIGSEYTFLDATYQSAETLSGSGNSTNDAALAGTKGLDGVIQIQPGNRIPLVPRHLFKAYGNLEIGRKLSLDLNLIAVSGSYARGNENNAHNEDGVYYLGPGSIPGYAVTNLGARYQVHRLVQLYVQVNNLFDRHYYTAAQLGPTAFTEQQTFIARPLPANGGEFPLVNATFYAPGAPVGVWGGVRVRF